MDLNDLRSGVTLLSFLIFAGIVKWALSSRNQARFTEARELPFLDEAVAHDLHDLHDLHDPQPPHAGARQEARDE